MKHFGLRSLKLVTRQEVCLAVVDFSFSQNRQLGRPIVLLAAPLVGGYAWLYKAGYHVEPLVRLVLAHWS